MRSASKARSDRSTAIPLETNECYGIVGTGVMLRNTTATSSVGSNEFFGATSEDAKEYNDYITPIS